MNILGKPIDWNDNEVVKEYRHACYLRKRNEDLIQYRERRRLSSRRFRARHPDRKRESNRRWQESHREYVAEYGQKARRGRKLLVLSHYSNGSMSCACCGEKILEFLSIDHINGGGTKHIRSHSVVRTGFYRWLIQNHYPPGFQVLCYNCNMAKGFFGKCPHHNHQV